MSGGACNGPDESFEFLVQNNKTLCRGNTEKNIYYKVMIHVMIYMYFIVIYCILIYVFYRDTKERVRTTLLRYSLSTLLLVGGGE
jgi:hypothetical protein